MIELNKIHKGHVLDVLKLIDDESVDCVTTSPPYYGLRSYKTEPQIWLDGKEGCSDHWFDNNNFCTLCNAWKGELGLEPTMELFLEHIFQIFDEINRILKPTGTCWINFGDTYNGSGQDSGKQNMEKSQAIGNREVGTAPTKQTLDRSIKRKSLLQIPSRFAIGMTDRGWILRNEIIWYKRNCMPSSAKDRFTVDFEKIYFFTKSERYFFEQQFEKLSDAVLNDYRFNEPERNTLERKERDDTAGPSNGGGIMNSNPLGRNKRCVWDIPPTPFPEAHFAVYPEELVEPMIRAGCPEEICNKCGKPKEKIYEQKEPPEDLYTNTKKNEIEDHENLINIGFSRDGKRRGSGRKVFEWIKNNPPSIRISNCKCEAGYHPGIVLDPFIGSGTSGIVARKLNRNFIGIELQDKYIDIAEKRLDKELGFFR